MCPRMDVLSFQRVSKGLRCICASDAFRLSDTFHTRTPNPSSLGICTCRGFPLRPYKHDSL